MVEGRDPVNRFNHTSWVAIATPTDRPKSVRNRCVIEGFGGAFVLSCCVLGLSVGIEAFVIRLSQISSFFSSWHTFYVLLLLTLLLYFWCTVAFGLADIWCTIIAFGLADILLMYCCFWPCWHTLMYRCFCACWHVAMCIPLIWLGFDIRFWPCCHTVDVLLLLPCWHNFDVLLLLAFLTYFWCTVAFCLAVIFLMFCCFWPCCRTFDVLLLLALLTFDVLLLFALLTYF